MQWASVFGVYGLTVLAVLILAAPAAVWAPPAMMARTSALRIGYPALMALVLAVATLWGQWRLAAAGTDFVDGVSLRIVQPSVPQEEKWKPENRAAVFQRYLQVSRKGGPEAELVGVTHLIWPESALPFLLAETPEALAAIADMLPEGTVLITGQARAERGGGNIEVFNSLFVMDHDARLLGHYDKVHLVPFGEYLPFQKLLESAGLEQLTRVRGGFTAGGGTRLTSAPRVPAFVALICYEIIFPDGIREDGPDPGWMLNVTNDAWFGESAGPYQHFHQARVRAVEQGLPVVRAANNGVTAVIDPYGRIVASLPRGAAAALDSGLPRAIARTPFVKWGRLFLLLLFFWSLVIWYLLSIDRSAKHDRSNHRARD
jgi:apolipoprotein N-acyltransferase